ncbi:hypothetical protein JCM10908_006753 [Rhodotorula pacifica]|uniref:uncharacterized protein n=1 Tax=Rhodotorula pacifica TaxID=1495444 RepID=UPI00317855AA
MATHAGVDPVMPGKPHLAVAASAEHPTPVVDMVTIEAAKENIVPLHSGRSASQLAALSSSTRSGLGIKLDAEHARFQAQIRAVDEFERAGEWPAEGKDGLTRDEVAQLAEDPLDASHQYVRFIVANYPAGASAANKLVPVLEATTRKFLGDPRYSNDPRYFRLWAHYAKNMEDPENCYRFLFAKGIAEKLAALYEEYAKVLEAKHKRKQADQVYTLGINRRAAPLDRLKRSYLDFQARMLIAPPVPSPPRNSTTASTADSRAVLGSSSSGASRPAVAAAGTGVGPKGNGSAFAIFRDGDATPANGSDPKAEWDDYGTVKSRTRENNEEKKEWEGETLPVKGLGAAAATRPGGGFKLEVYRDETATSASTASSHRLDDPDVFSRSSRAPSEAELLRSNPFRHYSARDLELIAKDPLEGLEVLPRATGKSRSAAGGAAGVRKTSAEGKERKSTKSASSSSSSSSSSSKATTSSSSASADGTRKSRYPPMMNPPDTSGLDTKPKERVAVTLREIYPTPGEEYSPEEVRALRKGSERYVVQEVERWSGWEWAEKFDEEVQGTGRTTYIIDAATGWPVLFDPAGLPLYDFLPRPTPPASPSPPTPMRETPSAQHDLLGPSPSPSSPAQEPPYRQQALDPHRPPSPTINTREANALADLLFAKTLDFTKVNSRPQGGNGGDSSDEDESSDDSDEDDEHIEQPSQYVGVGSESQFSTQGATQQSDISDAPFVPFSQTRSEMGDDSAFFGSQQRPPASGSSSLNGCQHDLLGALQEEEDESRITDENAPVATVSAPPPPMQLFRDAAGPATSAPESSGVTVPATPSTGAFRPVRRADSARAPLGAKPVAPLGAPPAQPSFGIFRDAPAASTTSADVPSSQPSQNQSLLDSSYGEEAEFEAPLRGGDSQEDLLAHGDLENGTPFSNDGYDLGRRVPGQPSRYAPFVAQMTPIVERTLEFTNATSLSASQRSRRESYYPTGAATSTLQEEDEDEEEPSTEEDDDEDNDRAFVASFAQPSFVQQQQQPDLPVDHIVQPPVLGGSSTTTSDSDDSSDSDSDSDSDGDDIDLAAQSVPELPPVEQVQVPARSSLGHDGSYDASGSATLPEGLTITGNQSEMATEMQVQDASTTRQSLVDAPVNPYSDVTLARLVDGSKVFEHPEVRDLTQQVSGRFDALQRTAKKREKVKGGKDRTGTIDEAWDLELAGETFSVREKLGEGAFGAVFRVAVAPSLEDEDDFDADEQEELSLAVKVEKPTNLWEFHVLTQLHARLPARLRDSIVSPHRLYAFADESFLCLGYCDQGSLLDAVNRANDSGVAASATGSASQGLDELLAMFFVIGLLRIVEGLHTSGFIHGDLKIDNCLLRLEDVPGGARAWSPAYDPSGAGGWSCKGVKVIDFGRTIDTTLFPEGQIFKSHLEVGQFDCAEVKEGRPWTYEPDYFGVASIAFNILFGRYIETKKVPLDEAQPDGPQKWSLVHTWRRYYQVELWTKVFDMLLNPHSVRADGSLPITNELAAVRHEMEEYLRVNGEKNGKSLRGLIRKLEIASMSR